MVGVGTNSLRCGVVAVICPFQNELESLACRSPIFAPSLTCKTVRYPISTLNAPYYQHIVYNSFSIPPYIRAQYIYSYVQKYLHITKCLRGCSVAIWSFFNLMLIRAFFRQKGRVPSYFGTCLWLYKSTGVRNLEASEWNWIWTWDVDLQIELTPRPSVQKLHTVKLPTFSVLLACNSGVL